MSCKIKRDRCNLDPLRVAAAREVAESVCKDQKRRRAVAEKKRLWRD